MARPSKHSPEFRSDAIALWRTSAGRRTFKDVAVDLNVNLETLTLRTWVRDADGSPALDSTSQGMKDEPARLRAWQAPAHCSPPWPRTPFTCATSSTRHRPLPLVPSQATARCNGHQRPPTPPASAAQRLDH